jgi:predicted dehydrogenase
MFDRGVTAVPAAPGSPERDRLHVSYRVGDMVAPALPDREALASVVEEFARAINEGTPPLTDGSSGVRVLQILEAADRSLARNGAMVALAAEPDGEA